MIRHLENLLLEKITFLASSYVQSYSFGLGAFSAMPTSPNTLFTSAASGAQILLSDDLSAASYLIARVFGRGLLGKSRLETLFV